MLGGGIIAHRHQPVLHPTRHQPHVDRIGHRITGRDAQRHHEPEQRLARPHRAHVAPHHQQHHDRRHTGHHRVHRDEFGHERLAYIFQIRPAHHLAHEQRLENQQAKQEAGGVFDDQIGPHRQANQRNHHRGENDAGRITSDTVHGRAYALFPQRLYERFMRARCRLLVRHHVEQQADRPHVERDQYEAPLHHRGFGIAAELIPRHIDCREHRNGKPRVDKDIDRLQEHRHSPNHAGMSGAHAVRAWPAHERVVRPPATAITPSDRGWQRRGTIRPGRSTPRHSVPAQPSPCRASPSAYPVPLGLGHSGARRAAGGCPRPAHVLR